MLKKFITNNARQTQKTGQILAKEICNGVIICLEGELGSGKTTFTQGLLKGLKVKGPYTSPTFVIMKHYRIAHNVEREAKNKSLRVTRSTLRDIYHIDAYRVKSNDIINLGWKELIGDKNNVIIVEWADKIRNIIPKNSLWINFRWIDENRRKIIFKC